MDILGQEVEISAIDRELRKLWEADEAFTKASLMNFAVYSELPDALTRNTPLISEITREHACRAILIDARLEEKESRARAWITAHCNLIGGRKAVCSEQISFQLDGKAIGRIRNIVFAHLESDLPLVLWWQGEFSHIFEPQFYNIIDRLIVDSADWKNPAREFSILQDALKKTSRLLVFHDLSWTRTYEIRATLAGLFDEPQALAELANLREVHIAHAPQHRPTAFLILAWLGYQLGWKYDATSRAFKAGDGSSITATLRAVDAAPVSSVELRSENGCFRVHREPGSRYLQSESKITDAHTSRQVTPADADSIAELISRQMSRGGNNQLLRKVLPSALELFLMF